MEWLLVGVGALALLVLVAGRRGGTPADRGGTAGSTRGPATAGGAGAAAVVGTTAAVTAAGPGSVRETVLGRALDPDDPDGAFMDGYVAGRYTERHATPHGRDGPGGGPPGSTGAADSEEDWPDAGWSDEAEDPSEEDAWSGLDRDHPTAQDVAWETGEADDLDDW